MIPSDVLLHTAILLVASLAQGFLGFGFGIMAMSALSFGTDLVHAASVVNVTGLLLTGWMSIHLRGHALWSIYRRIIPFLAVGVVCGVTALSSLDRRLMVTVLGLFVVAISLWNVVSPHLGQRESRWLDAVVGVLSGLFGGAFNTGGPPLVLHVYRRGDPPESLKATIQLLFLSISVMRLPMAALQGQMGIEVWREVAIGTPAVILGAWLGTRSARRVAPERLRRACWIGLALLGVGLLISR